MAIRWCAWISTRTWKAGGAFRSSTDFCVPRRRASSSESVTVCTPPTRSESVGFSIRFSREFPCAGAMSCTPRSALRRGAPAPRPVPPAADPVQGPLDARAVVAAELADPRHHEGDVLGRYLAVGQVLLPGLEARLRYAPEVHDDLEQPIEAGQSAHLLVQIGREGA